MKVKQKPGDFLVEELTDIVPGEGPFALYRLEKEGWTTPDALEAVQRRWRIERRRVSFGGLKDRHAHTIQHLTILGGPQRKLTHQAIRVTYVGQVPEAFTSAHIRANRFRVVVRALVEADLRFARQALEEVAGCGVPNYFDDQRFGSVVGHGNFIAKSLMLGKYEDALRLALTAPYVHDRSGQKKEKSILRSCWGDWDKCAERLERGHVRQLVEFLAQHPDDFAGAVTQLRPELRGLYLSVYQSHLWNRMLAGWLRANVGDDQLLPVHLRLGEYPMHRVPEPKLAELLLPLPSAKIVWEENDPRQTLFDQVLADEGLEAEQFKLTGLRDLFFSRGERAALCLPTDLTHESDDDEEHPGKRKLTLAFELPRGSYATLIVKRVTTS